jgi:hypothetical protein
VARGKNGAVYPDEFSKYQFRLEAVKKLANVHVQLLLRMLLIYTVES